MFDWFITNSIPDLLDKMGWHGMAWDGMGMVGMGWDKVGGGGFRLVYLPKEGAGIRSYILGP